MENNNFNHQEILDFKYFLPAWIKSFARPSSGGQYFHEIK